MEALVKCAADFVNDPYITKLGPTKLAIKKMGIELTWEEENGQELARLGDPQSLMQSWLPLETALEISCLRFIDPYGDTVFNRLQIPVLLQEMKSCKSSALNSAAAEHLDQAIALVNRAEDSIHTYIRFIGD